MGRGSKDVQSMGAITQLLDPAEQEKELNNAEHATCQSEISEMPLRSTKAISSPPQGSGMAGEAVR